jgi:hypothetical protein
VHTWNRKNSCCKVVRLKKLVHDVVRFVSRAVPHLQHSQSCGKDSRYGHISLKQYFNVQVAGATFAKL